MVEKQMIERKHKVKNTHFPVSAFMITLGAFSLMSGLHTALIVGINELHLSGAIQATLVVSYWILLSVGFTFFTGWQVRTNYEKPLKQLAEATDKVANGDFSVYIPTFHTADRLDYLDIMITDFNKMVEELGSIETLKVDFFSNVSHEIKTPIAVIQNSAEMLKNGNIDEAQKQEYITTIIQSSKKLSNLITNILKLNKLEKQNITPVMEAYDLCEQLCECSMQFEQVWEDKSIEFEADLEDEAVINADASLLELVWTNLLSNAFKFTPDGGRVLLQQTTTGNQIIVKVSDTGYGIEKDTIQYIFDKFYQGDTSHSVEGNGLGLALALRIIRMLEGTIAVESELGRGTTFTVSLPVNIEEKGDYVGKGRKE